MTDDRLCLIPKHGAHPRMKIRIRRMPNLFKPAALPVVGLSLLTLAGGHARALDVPAPLDSRSPAAAAGIAPGGAVEPVQAANPQPPAPVAGPTIGEIVVIGNKVLNKE